MKFICILTFAMGVSVSGYNIRGSQVVEKNVNDISAPGSKLFSRRSLQAIDDLADGPKDILMEDEQEITIVNLADLVEPIDDPNDYDIDIDGDENDGDEDDDNDKEEEEEENLPVLDNENIADLLEDIDGDANDVLADLYSQLSSAIDNAILDVDPELGGDNLKKARAALMDLMEEDIQGDNENNGYGDYDGEDEDEDYDEDYEEEYDDEDYDDEDYDDEDYDEEDGDEDGQYGDELDDEYYEDELDGGLDEFDLWFGQFEGETSMEDDDYME